MKPLIITKYFMAQFIEGDGREEESSWCIFRLMDFCNPALADGPVSLFSLSDESECRKLMEALDGVSEVVLAKTAGKKE